MGQHERPLGFESDEKHCEPSISLYEAPKPTQSIS